eukprot:g16185.t1
MQEGHVRIEAPPEESTCEAEIYALDACLHGQEKIANFINGIAGGKVAKDLAKQGWGKPPVVYKDNKGAIDLATTNIYRQKLDHIDLRYEYVNAKMILAGRQCWRRSVQLTTTVTLTLNGSGDRRAARIGRISTWQIRLWWREDCRRLSGHVLGFLENTSVRLVTKVSYYFGVDPPKRCGYQVECETVLDLHCTTFIITYFKFNYHICDSEIP